MADAPTMPLDGPNLSPIPGGGIAPSAMTESPVGNALQSAGEISERIYRDWQHRSDLTAHLAADNALAKTEQDLFYNPNTNGLFTQKTGDKAGPAVQNALQQYQSAMDKQVASAPDDRTRQMLQRSNEIRMADVSRQAFHYQVGEQNRYADEQSSAAIENAQQSASNDPSDHNLALQQERMQVIRMHDADRRGEPPEMVNAKVQADASQLWTMQIKRAVDSGDDARAQQLYDAHKQDIVPQHRDTVDQWVDASSNRAAVQKAIPGIVLDKNGNFDTDANIQQKLLDWKGDPKVKERLQTQADTLIAQNRQAVEQKQNNNYQAAYDALKKSGWDYDSVPTSLTTGGAISPAQDQALQNLSVKKARGQPIKDDPTTYLDLEGVFGDPGRRNEAKNINLLNYADRLSDASFKDFAKRQSDAKADNTVDLTKDALAKETIDSALIEHVMMPHADPTKSPQQAQDAALFTRRVRDIISENEADNKKPLNRADIQKICDDQMIQDNINGKMTPRYKVPGLTTQVQLGARVTPQDFTNWQTTLADPHSPAFAPNVATVVRWSRGIGENGEPNPSLQARARTIMDAQITPGTRQSIVDAWHQSHPSSDPSDADIINIWAANKVRTTPKTQPGQSPAKPEPVTTQDGWRLMYPGAGF
jgi:hypothetical protein